MFARTTTFVWRILLSEQSTRPDDKVHLPLRNQNRALQFRAAKGGHLVPVNSNARNPRTFDRRVFIRGVSGCVPLSYKRGARLLPFTGGATSPLASPAQLRIKRFVTPPTSPRFMGGQKHGQTGLVCVPQDGMD